MVTSSTIRPISQNTRDFSGNASATVALVIPYNPNRQYVAIQNLAATNISIGLGYAPTSTTRGIVLGEMGSYEVDKNNPFNGDIYILGTAAAEAFTAVEESG